MAPTGNDIAMAGPWGAAINFWDYKPKFDLDLSDPESRLDEITIWSNSDCVHAILFTYTKDGKLLLSDDKLRDCYIGSRSDQTGFFLTDEKVMDIGGTFGHHDGSVVIKSLSFRTNLKSYGPYGPGGGTTTFSLVNNAGDGNIKVAGFFGMYAKNHLENLGVYLKVGDDSSPEKQNSIA